MTRERVQGKAELGDVVTYFDIANQDGRHFRVVETPQPLDGVLKGMFSNYKLAPVDGEYSPITESDLRQHGWTFVDRPGQRACEECGSAAGEQCDPSCTAFVALIAGRDSEPAKRADRDGTAHLAYFDKESQLAFTWSGHGPVDVSHGGFGEPVTDRLDLERLRTLALDPTAGVDAVFSVFKGVCDR